MKVLFIGLLLSGLVAGEGLESLLNLCANPPKTPPVSLSDKISLPEQYKVSIFALPFFICYFVRRFPALLLIG